MSPSNYDGLRRFDNLRFKISDLSSAIFHLTDIEKFESEHPELFPEAPLAQANTRIATLERSIEWYKSRMAENNDLVESLKAGSGHKILEDELAQAHQKIATLEAEITNLKDYVPPPSKTAKASKVRDANTQKRWIGYSTAMVSVALDYHELCKKGPLTKAQVKVKLKEKNPGITDEAVLAFLAGLPEEKKKGPGAPPQS